MDGFGVEHWGAVVVEIQVVHSGTVDPEAWDVGTRLVAGVVAVIPVDNDPFVVEDEAAFVAVDIAGPNMADIVEFVVADNLMEEVRGRGTSAWVDADNQDQAETVVVVLAGGSLVKDGLMEGNNIPLQVAVAVDTP
jgi:hypothetical protein